MLDEKNYYKDFAKIHGWGTGSQVNTERAETISTLIIGKCVLDIGCATGVYVDYLSKKGYEAAGIDFVPDFIEFAKKNHQGKFYEMDALDLKFKPGQFDTILAFDILEHLDDKKLLEGIKKLKPKRVVAVVPRTTDTGLSNNGLIFRHHLDRTHARTYTDSNLRELFTTAGFNIKEVRALHALEWWRLLASSFNLVTPLISKLIFRLLFFVLIPFKKATYSSELMIVADL